ncbi:MAG: hypothetical protein GY841_15975 [FCB group bacterium]|nr:hypothetical protein [FCB group bacterium]
MSSEAIIAAILANRRNAGASPSIQGIQQPEDIPRFVRAILTRYRKGKTIDQIIEQIVTLNIAKVGPELGWAKLAEKPDDQPGPPSIETAHILWRGTSETDTAALVYPKEWGTPGAVLRDSDGMLVAQGNHTGPCEGCREFDGGAVYRFQIKGKDLPKPTILVAWSRQFSIPDPAREYDPR